MHLTHNTMMLRNTINDNAQYTRKGNKIAAKNGFLIKNMMVKHSRHHNKRSAHMRSDKNQSKTRSHGYIEACGIY